MSILSCIKSLIKRAVTTATPLDDKVNQIVQVKYMDKVTNCEIINSYGFASSPPLGSVAYVFSCNGNEQNQIGIANNLSKRFKDLKPGEVAISNTEKGTYIKLDSDGKIIIGGGDVIIKGNLSVEGDITDNSETNNASVKILRDAYNIHVHFANAEHENTEPTSDPVS